MKILLCVEYFHPSVGGAQEVVKQIALGLVKRGHHVCVATSKIPERKKSELDKIDVIEFEIEGNLVNGMRGDLEIYQEYVLNGAFDAILIYAAQQWTLDALLSILPEIKSRKILVPCGFSGLYLQEYKEYFDFLSPKLTEFDCLIFHSKTYRDFEFASKSGAKNCILIPNGASEEEFGAVYNKNEIREILSISSSAFVVLTVGSISGAKGHLEVARAFALSKSSRELVLILNGNRMPRPKTSLNKKFLAVIEKISLKNLFKAPKYFARRVIEVLGIRKSYLQNLKSIVSEINRGIHGTNKRAFLVNLKRPDLIKCFFGSDLFVFASMIEYSPLVLFEAAASELPILTVPVGNSEEIISWTQSGNVCPASIDERGYTKVNTTMLSKYLDSMIANENLEKMAKIGRLKWIQNYTWNSLVDSYEAAIIGEVQTDHGVG